jgi:hypothetical protein
MLRVGSDDHSPRAIGLASGLALRKANSPYLAQGRFAEDELDVPEWAELALAIDKVQWRKLPQRIAL